VIEEQTQRNMFKLRLFLDHITQSFSEIPPWDLAMDQMTPER